MGGLSPYWWARDTLRDLWTWLTNNFTEHSLLIGGLAALALLLWKMLKPKS